MGKWLLVGLLLAGCGGDDDPGDDIEYCEVAFETGHEICTEVVEDGVIFRDCRPEIGCIQCGPVLDAGTCRLPDLFERECGHPGESCDVHDFP